MVELEETKMGEGNTNKIDNMEAIPLKPFSKKELQVNLSPKTNLQAQLDISAERMENISWYVSSYLPGSEEYWSILSARNVSFVFYPFLTHGWVERLLSDIGGEQMKIDSNTTYYVV